MTGYYGNAKILARGVKVSMGIDVHKEQWHVTVLVADEELFHGRICGKKLPFQAPFAKSLLSCGLDHEGAITILVEAGGKS